MNDDINEGGGGGGRKGRWGGKGKHGGAGRRAGQGIKRKKKGGATAILFCSRKNKGKFYFNLMLLLNHWSVLVILDLINKYQNFPFKENLYSAFRKSLKHNFCQGPKHHMR